MFSTCHHLTSIPVTHFYSSPFGLYDDNVLFMIFQGHPLEGFVLYPNAEVSSENSSFLLCEGGECRQAAEMAGH